MRIEGAEAQHAGRVKRLGVGEAVALFDGAGWVAEAQVVEVSRQALSVRVLDRQRLDPIRPIVHLLAATPKGERAERMIDALSQLGAASFQPLRCARSIVQPLEGKQERWGRLAIESAKQARRAHLLRLGPPIDLSEALARAGTTDELIVLDAAGDPYQPQRDAGETHLFVGPEGGWTEEELVLCRAAGARIVALPCHTLRIETAAVAGLAVVMHENRKAMTTENST